MASIAEALIGAAQPQGAGPGGNAMESAMAGAGLALKIEQVKADRAALEQKRAEFNYKQLMNVQTSLANMGKVTSPVQRKYYAKSLGAQLSGIWPDTNRDIVELLEKDDQIRGDLTYMLESELNKSGGAVTPDIMELGRARFAGDPAGFMEWLKTYRVEQNKNQRAQQQVEAARVGREGQMANAYVDRKIKLATEVREYSIKQEENDRLVNDLQSSLKLAAKGNHPALATVAAGLVKLYQDGRVSDKDLQAYTNRRGLAGLQDLLSQWSGNPTSKAMIGQLDKLVQNLATTRGAWKTQLTSKYKAQAEILAKFGGNLGGMDTADSILAEVGAASTKSQRKYNDAQLSEAAASALRQGHTPQTVADELVKFDGALTKADIARILRAAQQALAPKPTGKPGD